MNKLIEKIKIIWSDPALRRRILFMLGALAVFRLMSNVLSTVSTMLSFKIFWPVTTF